MKILKYALFLFLVNYTLSCVTVQDDSMEQKIKRELTTIDSLLRSQDFSLSVAKTQDTAYYTGVGEPVPAFLTPAEDTATVTKSVKEEKIATSIAGFYAVECCIGLLCDQTHEKPTAWLEKIINNKTDTATILLLNRFANATWKAGQPFRALDRITRPVFTGASFLPADEVKKDFYQVQTAATKLLSSMQDVKDSTLKIQMQKIRSLLHSQSYALEMASFMEANYYTSQNQTAPPFTSAKEDTATVRRSVKEQKIATNVAGFYALECCTNYLVTTRNVLPSDVLKSIVDNTISKEDKNLFSRFANATWKAGQPFRGLSRIERETFTPFYFLSEPDIDKDWVQIKAAAKKLLTDL
ncbi:MAG: hypothetical protein ABJB86_04630 [Bacteroidota bacterium]